MALARAALTVRPPVPWASAFHAQQAVEKALKAFLVSRQVDHPFTHDLVLLIGMCGAPLSGDPRVVASGALTAYAVVARYPGFEPDARAAAVAVEIADAAFSAVRAAIAPPGGPRG